MAGTEFHLTKVPTMSDFQPTTVDGAEIARALRQSASERILVLDGAMGTRDPELKLFGGDFRGERFKGWNHDLKGNNDLLILTQPDASATSIWPISAPGRTSSRPTPSPHADRPGRLRHGGARL